MTNDINEKVEIKFKQLCQDPIFSKYIDPKYPIPKPYVGKDQIKLIVLGQDPTVKNEFSRKLITTSLNLNKRGQFLYTFQVCVTSLVLS